LIHGLFGDYLDWGPVLEPLSRSHRVVAVDLPGFGESDKPACVYSDSFFVDSLHGFLNHLGLRKVTLVGNSLGGFVALLYTLSHRETVERLVLVDSGGFREYTEQEKVSTRERLAASRLARLAPEDIRPMFAPVFAKQSESRERYLERQREKLQWEDYPAYTAALASSVELVTSHCLLDRLGEIHCPTLLLWGGEDQVLPVSQAEKALPLLQKGKLVVLPGCGHAPQLDCPGAFIAALEQFLDS
jgi:abhydrolase domain-containing protein 6